MASATRNAVHLQTLSRLLLLLAVPFGLGVFMWIFAKTAQQRADGVDRTLRVQISLERLETGLRTAEESQRGYLLTGDAVFLSTFQAAERSTREQLIVLAAATGDTPRHSENLTRMRTLLDARFTFLQSLIDAYRQGRLDRAAMKRAVEHQTPPMGSIQAVLDAIHAEEERLLALQETALANARRQFHWMFLIAYSLTVVVVTSLYVSVRRYSLQSAAAEERLLQMNERLEARVRERTAVLHAREELLNIFVRFVPAGVAMLDRDMRYLQVSDRWCSDFEIERDAVIGKCHYDVFSEIPDHWRRIHQRCLEGETLRADNDRWDRNGHITWLRWEIRPWGERDGLPEGILVFGEDITARKEAEESLRESEATTRTLLETAAQAIVAVDAGGNILRTNRMVEQIFGYSPGELIGQPHDVLVPLAARERHRGQMAKFAANPQPRMMGMGVELAGMRKDGSEVPIEVSLSSVQTKQGLLIVSFISDITARKQAEADLRDSEVQLRALAAKLLTAQEEERTMLARELHDDVTQQLAFLSMELGRMAGELPDSMKLEKGQMQALQKQVARASSEVRRISHGLHPSLIADFGLNVALEEFCEEFEKAYGIRVIFEEQAGGAPLKDLEATCLYRIAQEGMRNAVIHGHATEVTVRLQVENDEMQLQVRDNGTGFSADQARSKTGLGIVSMMERARLIKGKVQLSANVDGGVTLTASVPLKERPHGQSTNPPG